MRRRVVVKERLDEDTGVDEIDRVEREDDHHAVERVEEDLRVIHVRGEAFRESDRTVDVSILRHTKKSQIYLAQKFS